MGPGCYNNSAQEEQNTCDNLSAEESSWKVCERSASDGPWGANARVSINDMNPDNDRIMLFLKGYHRKPSGRG
jgi:hypothetical protein